MADTVFNTALISWIKAFTGLTTVFLADQSGPCPWPTPYATFKLLNRESHVHADYVREAGAEEGDINITHIAHNRVIMSVNIFHTDGASLHTTLWDSKNTYEMRNIFTPLHASLIDRSGVRNLTGLWDTKFVPRFQCDYNFNYQSLLVETNKTVEKTTVQGTIESDDVEITGWDDLP